MDIFKAGDRPSNKGNPDYFMGDVTIDPIVSAPTPARTRALRVHFAPGARTAWHTHPLGQTLHVVSGVGRIQKRGEPVREIAAGDNVWIPEGIEHWHGASANNAMCHIAIQEELDGSAADWLEHVSEPDYTADVE